MLYWQVAAKNYFMIVSFKVILEKTKFAVLFFNVITNLIVIVECWGNTRIKPAY